MTPILTPKRVRVLFVANDPLGGAVTRYRCENLAAALPSDRFEIEVVWVGQSRVRVNHDIIVLHRICTVWEGRQFAAAARACGATLVYGADDLVFDPDAFEGQAADPSRERMRRYAPLHAAMLHQADAVLVSTEFLAERARRLAGPEKPVFVLRNFLSEAQHQFSTAAQAASLARRRRGGPPTLAYLSGTATHNADLAAIAEPLVAVLRAHPETKLLLVGPVLLPSALADLGEARVWRLPLVPWPDLPRLIAEEVDLNLAPLDLRNPFNHGKSEIKLLEAAAVGVPTIASASAGFREALAPSGGKGGVLATSGDDWQEALHTLIGDGEARRAAGTEAVEYLRAFGTHNAHQSRVEAVFAEIIRLPVAAPAHPRPTTVGHPLAPKALLRAAVRRLRA